MTDLSFEDHGATWLMHSNTETAAERIKKYVPANAPTFGKAIVIDCRYAPGVIKLAFGQAIKQVIVHRYQH